MLFFMCVCGLGSKRRNAVEYVPNPDFETCDGGIDVCISLLYYSTYKT
jgi:hypothetical protein